MKKGLLIAALALSVPGANAQVVVDTVSVGAPVGSLNYPNQVWYSLPDDEQGSRIRSDWDIAFDLRNITSGVIVNTVTGVSIWKYPKGNLATGWSTVDTIGLSTWTQRYNADTSWAMGAIGRYADPNNSLNLDWGNYDMSTHVITGDSLFIIRLMDGTYKKFAIQSLSSGTYTFKYEDLNGANAQTRTVTKTSYAGKNFAYFNFAANAVLDREPLSANWDLVFTQYTTFLPAPYAVTGVLTNQGIKSVRVSGLPDVATNTDYASQTFSSQINTIGYNWKTFTGTAYAVRDSQLYFVRRANGDIWKLVFKGFGGAANGNFIFSKQKIYTVPTGVGHVQPGETSITLYPNPAQGQQVHVIYHFGQAAAMAKLAVYDLAGRLVHTATLDAAAGLHQYELPAAALRSGTYIVSVQTGSGSVQQKLVIP